MTEHLTQGIAVGRHMIKCRARAPDVYRKTFALHYHSILVSDKSAAAAELEAAVKTNPAHALTVISALVWANAEGAHYEGLIGTLHAMRALPCAWDVGQNGAR